jgi:hypothetical protein
MQVAKRFQKPGDGAQDPTREYKIADPHHKPDLNGELGGARVYMKNGVQYVRLTPAQAKFYVDSGSLVEMNG